MKATRREQVIACLRESEAELRAAGIAHLSVFGSTARGDQRPDSDVDLVASFDPQRRLSLLGVASLQLQLTHLLGHTVDLVEASALKPGVRAVIQAEAVRAF